MYIYNRGNKMTIKNKIEKILGATLLGVGLTFGSACDKNQREVFTNYEIWGDNELFKNTHQFRWRIYDNRGREIEFRENLVTLDQPMYPYGEFEKLKSKYKNSALLIIKNKYAGLSEKLAEQTVSKLENGGYYSEKKLIFGPEEEVIKTIVDINGDGTTDWIEKPMEKENNVEITGFDLNADGAIDITVTGEDYWTLRHELTKKITRK